MTYQNKPNKEHRNGGQQAQTAELKKPQQKKICQKIAKKSRMSKHYVEVSKLLDLEMNLHNDKQEPEAITPIETGRENRMRKALSWFGNAILIRDVQTKN